MLLKGCFVLSFTLEFIALRRADKLGSDYGRILVYILHTRFLSTDEKLAEFEAFQDKLAAHEYPTAREVLKVSKMFSHYFTFSEMKQAQLHTIA